MRDVVFSCDDNGARFLRVTVWSLLKHYKGPEPIRINVFEGFGGHGEENKAKHDGRALPNCDRYADTLVRLPLYYGLAPDQDKVLTAAKSALA